MVLYELLTKLKSKKFSAQIAELCSLRYLCNALDMNKYGVLIKKIIGMY